jgi:hypothetical protein
VGGTVRIRFVAVVIVAVAGAAGAGLATVAQRDDEASGAERGGGLFYATCYVSHRGPDDPIVFPGRPGRSHLHDFLGNNNTDAYSTPQSLRAAGPTSCNRPTDRSAYWVPTLYEGEDRVPVDILQSFALYQTGERDAESIQPFPKNFQMIAGDADSSGPQPVRTVDWRCTKRGESRKRRGAARPSIPTCAPGSELKLQVIFPDCWDGRRLDSADHQSHVAYSIRVPGDTARACPRSHPVLLPVLRLLVKYATRGGPDVRLSAGDVNAAHADFVNAWDQDLLERLVRDCLNADKYCGNKDAPRDERDSANSS